MKPDEKYMSEIYLKDENKTINFIPPSFNRSLMVNDSTDEDSNNFLDLFPSETDNSELFCYYSSFGDCDSKNMNAINKSRMPSTFDILRDFDLDLDESKDLQRNGDNAQDKIFTQIETKHPAILETFSTYNIPTPISKVMIKRLIKLTLLYSDEK